MISHKSVEHYIRLSSELLISNSLELIVSLQRTKSSSPDGYLLPARSSSDAISIGICNPTRQDLTHFLRILPTVPSIVIHDVETKGRDSFANYVSNEEITLLLSEYCATSRVIHVGCNQLTAHYMIARVLNKKPISQFILHGLGSITTRIAFGLLDSKLSVHIYSRRDISYFNYLADSIESKSLLSTSSSIEFPFSADAPVGVIVSSPIDLSTFREYLLMLPPSSFITSLISLPINQDLRDLAESRSIEIEYFCIGRALLVYAASSRDFMKPPRACLLSNNRRIVSSGYLAAPGDTVVDDVNEPRFSYGTVDSNGKYTRDFQLW